MSLNSSLDNKRSQKSGPKTSDSFNTPEKFVRIRPVEVNVDRSMERNIDQKQFIFSPSSPHTPTTLLIEETEPEKSVSIFFTSLNIKYASLIICYLYKDFHFRNNETHLIR